MLKVRRLRHGGMMNTISHGMTGYHIPAYMEEILTRNYCPFFVRMTIVRDGDTYRFSYRPGNFTRLDIASLDTYERLVLLRSVITVCDSARGYLIDTENYLLEPELIYSSGNSVLPGNIRILFYPDIKRMKYTQKLMLFSERIRNNSIRNERELMTSFRDTLDSGDINKARMFLDKQIIRIESRQYSKAG